MNTQQHKIKQPYEIQWKLEKYDADQSQNLTLEELEGISPKETVILDGNALLTQGRDLLNNLLIGTSNSKPLNNANALIHVGSSTSSVSANQTELQASGEYNSTSGAPQKWKKGMEGGYPQLVPATGAIRFRSRFVSAEANFTWNEFGVSNGETLFNRRVASPSIGTKTTEDEWVFSVEFFFS